MSHKYNMFFLIPVLLVVMLAAGGCGGGGGGSDSGGPVKPENIEGDAILDIQLVDSGHNSTAPAPPEGYTLLDIDLNGRNTGGNYIWLYYKVGKADGSEGDPISRIYTVDEYDGETDTLGGTKLPVNLNEDNLKDEGNKPLWLYYIKSDWPVVRSIVVYQRQGDWNVVKYGPPEAEGQYDIVWVQELVPDNFKSPYDDIHPDAQDLNEGQSNFIFLMSDYLYIGYGVD